MCVKSRIFLVIIASLFSLSGCVTLPRGQVRSFPCPYEGVWKAAVTSLDGYPIVAVDQKKGEIKTTWVEAESEKRFGVFQREGGKERARFFLALLREGGGTRVRIVQQREVWMPGGSRSLRWQPVPSSGEAEGKVLQKMGQVIGETGC